MIIGGVSATDLILNDTTVESPIKWIKLLVVFDLLYMSISLMLFRFIVEE